MNLSFRGFFYFLSLVIAFLTVGFFQSWNVMLAILNLCLISSIMALGVNIQWGYAGIFNVGIMGFSALGGVAAVLASREPVPSAWLAGGSNLAMAGLVIILVVVVVLFCLRQLTSGLTRTFILVSVIVTGYVAMRSFYDPAVLAIEANNPSESGFLGGMGIPIIFSWALGGVFSGLVAWLIGKVALGLRSDYLAIATLGISEILVSVIKNEDWLTRGVKNVTGLGRPVPYEVDLQKSKEFISWIEWFFSVHLNSFYGDERTEVLRNLVVESSSIVVKISYSILFFIVLLFILVLCILSLSSPWGRMVRSIRDNETSAAAMGKNIKARHLQIFVLGSAVIGIAGAMLTTLDGQFTPGSYQPLRFTFLIWVMVIVGGSGNNFGAVLGAFIIWFIWIEAEPVSNWIVDIGTLWMGPSSLIRSHLLNNAQHIRLLTMGLFMLFIMRFSPDGLLPEQSNNRS
ncbi:branched-chain amino acid ABC transporter permease [Candidatus Endowatersipora endosymbiont of Watersipora subatra]|uniref:branched-chain amino acid ABC transporter permease n=1 Tax=Candidatus Endowatersipora endosymbiont of Watersipora subatra TaxID=3077946 RepID=UPI00312C9B27